MNSTSSLKILKRLFVYLSKYKLQLLGAGIALVFTAAVTLAMGQGVKELIDRGFVGGSTAELTNTAKLIILIAILMAVGTYIRFFLVSWLGERVTADLRKDVFNHLTELHPSYFEENRSGEIMSRLTTDTTLLQTVIGSSASMALRSSLTMIGGLIMLILTNIKLTAVVFACVPIVLIPILLFGRRVRSLSRASQDSIADVGTHAGEIIQQIKTVQSFTKEEFEKSAFSTQVESAFSIAIKRIRQRALLIAAVIALIFGGVIAIIWVGGQDVINGNMTAGELGAFVFYAIIVASAVATISEVIGDVQRAVGAAERLFELLDIEALIKPPAQKQALPNSDNAMTLSKVNFCYPSRPKVLALDSISLDIEAGKTLALVGPSGAGKSTVFELLQRFYDPSSGEIHLGNTDIKQLSPKELRSKIGAVSQQPALFSGDVRHNIAYGKDKCTEQEIVEAAKAAHAHEFISQLPDGYDSFLGEQGVRLSGGQKQRIAIARAILKDPQILLLDEATSALDSHSEQQVQLALTELMKNRTTVVIAHRLSTIVDADSIAVLDQGKLVAQGTHSSLLESSALYRQLAELQFDSLKQPQT